MNQAKIYLFILFFIGLVWIGCDKKIIYPEAQSNNSYYPSFGKNPIGMTILGDASYNFSPIWLVISGGYFNFYGIDSLNQNSSCKGYESLNIRFQLKSVGDYPLFGAVSKWGFCSTDTSSFATDSIHIGTVNISKFDSVNNIIAGTFSFVAEEQSPLKNGGTDSIIHGYINNFTW